MPQKWLACVEIGSVVVHFGDPVLASQQPDAWDRPIQSFAIELHFAGSICCAQTARSWAQSLKQSALRIGHTTVTLRLDNPTRRHHAVGSA